MPEESIQENLKRRTRVRIDWTDGNPPTLGRVTLRGMRHPTENCWWYFVREDGSDKSVRIQGTALTVLPDSKTTVKE